MKNFYNVIKSLYINSQTGSTLKCYLNLIKWQVGSRLLGCNVIIDWIDDSKLIVQKGDTGLTGNLYFGLSEFSDMMFLLHSLQENETFIDVGANLGSYSILSSKVIGSQTISFEPVAKTFERLKQQIILNEVSELVTIHNKGVGSKKEYLYFTINNDTMNKVYLDEIDEHVAKVEVTTLDSTLDENGKYFIKIDVEGFEYHVIQGGINILKNSQVSAIIVETNESSKYYGYGNQPIHNFLINLNYIPVVYDPFQKKLTILYNFNQSMGNTIYIKNYDETVSKINSSKKYLINPINISL
jgi:FkbM family methyltransferase